MHVCVSCKATHNLFRGTHIKQLFWNTEIEGLVYYLTSYPQNPEKRKEQCSQRNLHSGPDSGMYWVLWHVLPKGRASSSVKCQGRTTAGHRSSRSASLKVYVYIWPQPSMTFEGTPYLKPGGWYELSLQPLPVPSLSFYFSSRFWETKSMLIYFPTSPSHVHNTAIFVQLRPVLKI